MDWKKVKDWFKKKNEMTVKAEAKVNELMDQLDPNSPDFLKNAVKCRKFC